MNSLFTNIKAITAGAICMLTAMFTDPAAAQTDITNSGGTMSAQYTDSPSGEDITKVIDNLATTKYLTFHSSGWIQFQSTGNYIVTAYAITSANDAPERDPLNWTLQGSTNGSTWTTLNTQSNQDFPNRNQRRQFSFSNSTAYNYYRLQMSNNSGTILQLAEWELLGTAAGGTGVATVYQHTNYGGTSGALAVGTYTLAQLQAKGIQNNWVSSVRVNNGYRIIFYDSDNFSGATLTKSADDASLVDDTWNDRATSIKVEVNTTSGDWSNFVYPTVVLDDRAAGTQGSNIFHTAVPDAAGLMRAQCLEVCKKIYADNNDPRVNFTKLNLWLEDNDAVASKWGAPPEIWISVSVRHIANVYSQNGNSYTAVANEIKGILSHEGTHGYQWEPKNAGGYQSGTDFYGFIEGLADYVRIATVGFQPARFPSTGGHWNDGYTRTGFFVNWCVQNKKSSFAIELNQTARDFSTWSWDAACRQITGQGVQTLWNEYQASLSSARVAQSNASLYELSCSRDGDEKIHTKLEDLIELYPNPTSRELWIKSNDANDERLITFTDFAGATVKKASINSKSEAVDVADLAEGWYVVTIKDVRGRLKREKIYIKR